MNHRLQLVRREMRVNGFRPLRVRGIPGEAILEEIATCFSPEIHEHKIAPYGVIFCSRSLPSSLGVKFVPVPTDAVGLNRRFADGRRSFLVYQATGERGLGVFRSAYGDEYRLLELSRAVSGLAVQRQETGVVKLVQKGEIHTVRGRTWSRKESVVEPYRRIVACLGAGAPTDLTRVILGLIQVSYYCLSPEGVGGTMVWRFADTSSGSPEAHTDTGIRSLGLSVNDATAYPLIRHILRHEDGAAFVNLAGELEATGVHLTFSDIAMKWVPQIRGTRHTAAARYTYDHDDTLAFVVSQDGSVTVFSDGANVAQLPIEGAKERVRSLKKMVPSSKKPEIWGDSFVLQCKSCGRHICVEQVTVAGWKDRECVDCPVCGNQLHSAMCFSLDAYPIKFRNPPGRPPL